MSSFELPEIKQGDVVEFYPSALPDPANTLRCVPCVTVVHNGKRITMQGQGGLSYIDALRIAIDAANQLSLKAGVAHA